MKLTERPEWKALQTHWQEMSNQRIASLFQKNPKRGEEFSCEAAGIYIDFSKNLITEKTLQLLTSLASAVGLDDAIEKMFNGERINVTENRAVLHTALRNSSSRAVLVDGKDVMPDVSAELKKMEKFCHRVHSGEWRGKSGLAIRHVVNIGIGGSDLGPAMIVEALKPYHRPEVKLHFVSNVDGANLDDVLKEINLEETLFLIASKTFTTSETMTNAHAARNAVVEHYKGDEAAVANHFVALSTNEVLVHRFGIDLENMFLFWDWVGGRYSSWSAIGLSIALAVGIDRFQELLSGAEQMDRHFRIEPFLKNLPVLSALIGVWYNNFGGCESYAVLPYHQHLNKLPAFLQQLDMESNGKQTTLSGDAVSTFTGAILWGDVGTNCQHAFFQLLHQGTRKVPADFILAINAHHSSQDHQNKLMANCLAQTEALMVGKSAEEVVAELKKEGKSDEEIRRLAPHKIFEGNRPSTTILIDQLTPATLGALVAFYEHRVFVQGVIWGINSFDQYGVELGKVLAAKILKELESDHSDSAVQHDSSTQGLIQRIQAKRA